MNDLRHRIHHNGGLLAAIGLFIVMFIIYVSNHPVGLTAAVATTASNKAVLLALVAMAQTLPVLTRGLDLSVGMVFILANCLASVLVVGTIGEGFVGIVPLCLGAGALAGFINGAIIVWGRLQPIITTLATGAVYYGIALYVRPGPGGDVQSDIADFATGQLFGVIPTALVVLLAIVLIVWVPYRNSVLGRAAYAVGSNEQAAYMSGVPVQRAKLLAYTLAGFLAAIGGLMLTFNTYSGEASCADRQHLYAQFHRGRGDWRERRCSAVGARLSDRSSVRSCFAPSKICFSCLISIRCGSRCSKVLFCLRR